MNDTLNTDKANSSVAHARAAAAEQGAAKQDAGVRHVLSYSTASCPLSDEAAQAVISELHEGMAGYNVKQYFGSQQTIFRDYAHLTIAREAESKRAVALLGTRWFRGAQPEYLYLWTAMVADKARNTGLLGRAFRSQLACIVEECGAPSIIATKTYNPFVLKALQRLTELVPGTAFYPDLALPKQEPAMVEIARHVVSQLCPHLTVRFDDAVVEGGQASVGPDFFPVMPSSGDAVTDAHFKRHLSKKDQVLVVVSIPNAAVRGLKQLVQGAETATR